MKKFFKFALMATLTGGLSLVTSSCKDDDDEATVPSASVEEQEAKVADDALVFWNVMSQLTNIEGALVGHASQRDSVPFEPTIGIPAEGQPQTRIVPTNSLAAAVASFNDLTGADITEQTQEYTWQNDAVGTLTWHKTGTTSLATVDVNIPQMPHLSQIMYMTPEQMGLNASWECCYYRFGDVISRKRPEDGVLEYWVCVRPSFDPEGKGDSHWVTVSPLPQSNIDTYRSSKGKDYALPTKLGLSKEHMQNLAELLYAMNYSEDWSDNIYHYSEEGGILGPSGLPFFHDFHKSKYAYNNENFFKNVQKLWVAKGIYQKAFGYSSTYFKNALKNDGLHLLAEGYSWLWKFSNYLSLYEYTYTNGAKTESNMHKMTYRKVTQDVIKGDIVINVKGMTAESPYLQNSAFFGNDAPRFIVRHATGEELSIGGAYNKQQALAGTGIVNDDKPIKEVYRYYYDVYRQRYLATEPEITKNEDDTKLTNAKTDGQGYYLIGDVVMDEYGNRWFCIAGAPKMEMMPITDHDARFVSFDFNEVDTKGNTVAGLPKEEELPELSVLLCQFAISRPASYTDVDLYIPGEKPQLSVNMQHILSYAGVNLDEKWIWVDSVFTFTSLGNTYKSHSNSCLFNIAYDDGTNDRQAIARIIFDNTLSGSERNQCAATTSRKKYDFWTYRCYKHYETYDPKRMRQPTDDEKELGVNTWCLPWAMTTDKIRLQDIASQDMVTRHGADDKWVTLPLFLGANRPMEGPRRKPRTEAVGSIKPSDCMGEGNKNRHGMFNEPVMFLRFMKVRDEGGTSMVPNLTSNDGRKLTVVHMQDDGYQYRNFINSAWASGYCTGIQRYFYIDNVQVPQPPLAGWPIIIQ